MRILFIGTGGIGVPVLQSLFDSTGHQVIGVVTQPDKPAGRKQELQPSPIKQVALLHGVPVLQPARMRAPDAIAAIEATAPEVIVVMAYGQILPKEVLDTPSIACLNLHASLLPKYRGAAPIQAAIEAGDAATGITVMYMAEGLDTGDILLEKRIPIRRRETGGTLHDRLAVISPPALAESFEDAGTGDGAARPAGFRKGDLCAKAHPRKRRHRLECAARAHRPQDSRDEPLACRMHLAPRQGRPPAKAEDFHRNRPP